MVVSTGVLKLATPAVVPPGPVQLNSLTGPPEEVQLRVNSGTSASGPEVNVNGVPAVQSTVTVPAEGSSRSGSVPTDSPLLFNVWSLVFVCVYNHTPLSIYEIALQLSQLMQAVRQTYYWDVVVMQYKSACTCV